MTLWESFATWSSKAGRLRLELNAENDFGDVPQGKLVLRLFEGRAIFAFAPDLATSALAQYDSEG